MKQFHLLASLLIALGVDAFTVSGNKLLESKF